MSLKVFISYADENLAYSLKRIGRQAKRLALFDEIILWTPEMLPDYVKDEYLQGVSFHETADLMSVISKLDILYMTRVQQERFFNEADYIRLKDSYVLTVDKLEKAKNDMIVMHPLPRVNEISVKVDDDPRACYFKQVSNGKLMRMALILKLLEIGK